MSKVRRLLDKLLAPFKCNIEEAEKIEDVTYHLEELLKTIRRSIFAFFLALLVVALFPINWITCPLFHLYCNPHDVGNVVGAQYIADLIKWLGYVPAMVALLRVITVAVMHMGV